MIKGVPSVAAARRWPVVSLLLALAAGVIHFLPGAPQLLQLDRAPQAAGQWWRLMTCHLTHFSNDHLFWDLLMFMTLGAVCERIDRRRFVATVLVSMLIISMGVVIALPGIETYRGLSGIDSALFGLLATTLLIQQIQHRQFTGITACGTLLTGFAAKVAIETVFGVTVFADSAGGAFVPVPLAHALGVIIGAVASFGAFADNMNGHDPEPHPHRRNRIDRRRPVA